MKRLIISTLLCLFGIAVITAPVSAEFNPFGEACENVVSEEENPAACEVEGRDPITGAEGEGILIKATKLVTTITGVAAVIIIIFAAIQYVTSAGDANKVSGAKQTIIFAAVGLAIALIARGLIVFVIRRLQ